MEKSLDELVNEFIADGELSREELKAFEAKMLADGEISLGERKTIDRLLSMITSGAVKVVD